MSRSPFSFVSIVSALALSCLAVTALAQGSAPKPPKLNKDVQKAMVGAQTAARAEKWDECLALVTSAEAVAAKGPYDVYVINDMLRFCSVRAGNNAVAARAFEALLASEFLPAEQVPGLLRGLLQLAYNDKEYDKAIEYGGRIIERGEANDDIRLLVAQSHYLKPDYQTTRVFTEKWVADDEQTGEAPAEMAIRLWVSSCLQLDDEGCIMSALTKQAAYHPREETWPNLMVLLFRGAPETATLDIFRLGNEVNALRRGEEYTEMAQLAIERGLPGEAEAVLEKGFARGVFESGAGADLAKRLLASAKNQAAADKPVLARQERDSAAGTNGQVDVRIGQAFMSYGQYAEAVAAIERGLAKGSVRNVPEAQLSLGIARMKKGDAAGAMNAFAAVKDNGMLEKLAGLWAVRTPR